MTSFPEEPMFPGFILGPNTAKKDVLERERFFFLWKMKDTGCTYLGQYYLLKMRWALTAYNFRNLPNEVRQ
jgi:hypothetical protein